MSVHWLIEVDVFPETAGRVTAALDAREAPWTQWSEDMRPGRLPASDHRVVFWGSLGAAYKDNVASHWTPGAIGDVDRFFCSAYYTHLRPLLANADTVHSTVATLAESASSVLASLGSPERVFVRPDSPLKPFSGRELATSDITLAALDHGFYYDDENLPVVASTPKKVGREWRFVIANGAVVTGCEYEASRRGVGSDLPASVTQVAEQVAALEWQAAPIYVADVGEVDDKMRVLELNPFSGADLYHCDPDLVIDAVERLYAA